MSIFAKLGKLLGSMKYFSLLFFLFSAVPENIRKEGGVARIDNRIVAAKQGNVLAPAFHPELTEGSSVFFG
jgi:glutamine amidotransferase PdxT